ncbi:hypothetical protein Y032_0097g2963 [Ancylostoma ceylanicum]|uniref:Uncharacterized protein n=1 Tax=Ancylostoma ceylanicum TaxID=53326 RepID=A0A016TJF8_9BILA|nr:hypothetical protein Y032_0097g2963 [Ancylostoma ceylanicum]
MAAPYASEMGLCLENCRVIKCQMITRTERIAPTHNESSPSTEILMASLIPEITRSMQLAKYFSIEGEKRMN